MSTSRSYRSTVREESARRTRQLVADAARELFLTEGYAETSVAAIARKAGVSTQTVYNVFGTKADLLKHLYDVTLVGDALRSMPDEDVRERATDGVHPAQADELREGLLG